MTGCWLWLGSKTLGKLPHSAFIRRFALIRNRLTEGNDPSSIAALRQSSVALRRVERAEGNEGASVVFDSEGVTNFSLRKRMALGWAASGNTNRSQTASKASEDFAAHLDFTGLRWRKSGVGQVGLGTAEFDNLRT